MKKRRRLSHLFVLILGLFVIAGYATVSEAAVSKSDFSYQQSETTILIKKYNGISGEVDFSEAFPDAAEITIDSYAFYGKAVTKVVLPDSVVSVGEKAFSDCKSLQTVTFAAGTGNLVLGKGVFEGCGSLTGLELPDCVSAVPERLCYGCSSLGSVTLPEACTSIGKEAFMNCSSLESIRIPGSCTSIGNSAFTRCSLLSLAVFEEPADVRSTFVFGTGVFSSCAMLTTVSLPEGCTKIPASAFWCCKSLKSVWIPDSCTSIQDSAFYNCSALSQINSIDISDAILPKACISVGKEAFRKCTSLKNVELPSTCASVGDNAFNECTGLYEVTFLNPDTSIGTDAFPAARKAPNLVISCDRGSSVAMFAENNGISYKTDVQSIMLTKLPVVTEYMYSEDRGLDLNGMEVEAQVISETADTGFVVEKVELSKCTISGFDSTKPGKQTIKVAYAGSQTSFEIKVYCNFEETVVTAQPVIYTGEYIKPSFNVYGNETGKKLNMDTDYICICENNIEVGTAAAKLTGIGNYKGEKTVSFQILPKTISESNTIVYIEDMEYTGSQQKPVPEVVCGAKTLLQDTDYTVTYGSNTDVGEGFVVIEGTGNYDGSVKKWFHINAGSESGGTESGGNESGGDKGGQAASGGGTSSGDTGKNDSGSADGNKTPADLPVEKPEKGKTYIYNNMYYKVTGSETVTFMKPVKKNIKKIEIPSTVSILGKSFKVTKVNKKACYKNKKVTSITVGNNVTHIGDMAFAYCSKLKYVTLGTDITHIGKRAMYQNKKMKKVVIRSKKLKKVGKYAFKGFWKKSKTTTVFPNEKKLKEYEKMIDASNK